MIRFPDLRRASEHGVALKRVSPGGFEFSPEHAMVVTVFHADVSTRVPSRPMGLLSSLYRG
jgi:hypothetical protein